MALVNTGPVGDALAQQAESRHHRYQQQDQEQRLERLALNRVHPSLQESVDPALICVRELLSVVKIVRKVRFWHVGVLLWFKSALYRLRVARPSAR